MLMDFGQAQTVLDKAAAQIRTTGCSTLLEAMFFFVAAPQPTFQVMLSNIQDFVLARALLSLLLSALQSTKFCICAWFVVRTFGVTPDLHAEKG